MKKNMFFFIFILHFSFCIFHFSIAPAIEVGGHLTEDTTWSPVNNPYILIDNIYVDEGVTLTILPGTEIKITGASCTNWQELDQSFWFQNGNNDAKMFWVDGRIIAEATEQDSIIFTRMQDDPDFYWGNIYITEQAEMCRFKCCKIEYSVGIGIAIGDVAKGAISIYNGEGLIINCLFNNNGTGLVTRGSLVKNLEISGSIFSFDNNINDYVEGIWGSRHISIITPAEGFKPALLANNEFINDRCITASSVYYVDNQNTNCMGLDTGFDDEISYFYNNYFSNCDTGIDGSYESYLFIKNNRFLDGSHGVDIDYAYVEILDNYFEGCDLDTGFNSFGKIFNNRIDGGLVFTGNNMSYYNNIIVNYNGASSAFSGYLVHDLGNIYLNNSNVFNDNSDTLHTNCIILQNEELFWSPILHGTDTFRNCIIDFELEYPLIDGGGNIWVDSLQAQTLFEDIQNGDFHLIEGSLAIDAGFDTLGYYYPFDMDYNHRVWDGDNNGTSIIDIGPYEYNSPAWGGIEGFTYNPSTGEPVDYVLIKIDDQPGEFTFSDSIGNFQFKLPAGTYDVYAERVFYDDAILYEIEVNDGQFTQIQVPMIETVDVEEHTIPHSSYPITNLSNFPNPFNPETTISFSVTQTSSFVNLAIFNIKGQKVRTLNVTLSGVEGSNGNEGFTPSPSTTLRMTQAGSKTYSIVWNGKDSNNKVVASGIYFYKISSGKESIMKKMLLLK